MIALLDTHTLIWANYSVKTLSPTVLEILTNGSNEILVSAASAWEIATKVRIGRMPEGVALEARFMESVQFANYTLLPIDVEVALSAGRLSGAHKDPFDRIIAAQALALDVPVLSVDAKLDYFGVRRIW